MIQLKQKQMTKMAKLRYTYFSLPVEKNLTISIRELTIFLVTEKEEDQEGC